VVTRICVSVCLFAAVRPHYCTDLDVTLRRGRGYPLVVHYWADLQSGHRLHCYDNMTRTLVTSLRPSRDMTTWCEWPSGRGLRARTQNVSEYMLVLALCLVVNVWADSNDISRIS